MAKSGSIFEDYIQSWMPKNPELLPFYIGLDKILKDLLPDVKNYDIDRIGSKIIADPLLGYIHLTAVEVAIVDTKLFQRLRKIRQLGLANLVFPTLGYSRFEHSLGVLGRLNQILFKILENNNRVNTKDMSLKLTIDDYYSSIRLAALMHDVGHCLFSHCSERIIEKIEKKDGYPSPAEINEIFQQYFKKPNRIPIAEILSVVILGSKRFFEFLRNSKQYNDKELERVLKNATIFILGMPIEGDSNTVFLAQLISSGLDVDKIDYMVREQHYTGIKLEIDLDRILSKLRVFDIKYYDLPSQLQYLKKFYKADNNIKVLGLEKGGQFVFEEFCVARLALHVKIYLHQKVRAAEAQLSKYLTALLKSPILSEVHNWLTLPESIIEYPQTINLYYASDGSLFSSFSLTQTDIRNLRKIDNRNILHRSFAFGPNNSYSDPTYHELEETLTLTNYFNQFDIDSLKEKIIKEAHNIIDLLSEEIEATINDENLDETIIDIPRLINIQQGHESLFFERATFIPVRWTIPIDKILIYFQENRALGYIFSSKEIAPFISIASEKILFEEKQKVYSQESFLSQATFNDYMRYKNLLTEKGYYKTLPRLKPLSEYLKTAEAVEKVKALEDKLKAFKSFTNEHITINNITTFVNQFPEHLQDACLDFLGNLKIYHENLLSEELDELLRRICDKGKRIAIAPLGALSDSGGRLSYHMKTTVEKYGLELTELISDELISENDILVLFDDNINSGLQLLNIFAGLTGETKRLGELDLEEQHNKAIKDDEAIKKFKSMPIYVVYIVGYKGVEQTVQNLLSSKLDFSPSNIHIKIHTEFSIDQKIFSGSESRFNHKYKIELRDAFSEIGEKLLRNEKKSEEKIELCKLGYAKAEAMVLFPYNIPTMSVTALWCKGLYDDIPWIPLAERRRRSKQGKFIGEY